MAGDWNPAGYLENAIKDVLTGSQDKVARTIDQAALFLACTGYLQDSDRLVEGWQRHHDRLPFEMALHTLAPRAWTMLWHARGIQPAWAQSVPPLDIDHEEQAHRRRLAKDRWSLPSSESPFADLSGLDLLRAGLDETRKGASLSALELMERFLDSGSGSQSVAIERESAALGAELAVEAGDLDRARTFLGEWVRRVPEKQAPDLYNLASCRHLALLLVAGALAEPLGVTADWARQCADELRTALDVRETAGRDQLYRDLSWPELVERIIAAETIPDLPPLQLAAPATEDQVRACEERLGLSLPSDYREFLCTVNGLPKRAVSPELLDAGRIEPLSKTTDETARLVREEISKATFERAIRVSAFGDSVVLLVSPIESHSPWKVVSYQWDLGQSEYPTFRHYLENELRLSER